MKTVLIVGASSGIGLALAKQMAGDGTRVIATWNTHSPPDISGVEWHPLNVLDDEPQLGFLPEILDGVVYCPGAIVLKPFTRFQSSDFIRDYQLQVVGAIKVLQAAIPALKKSHHASVVLFSTVAVRSGFAFHSLVSSSKGAIEGLGMALAAEYAPAIRFNVVAPSLTQTPLASSLLGTPERIGSSAQRHPMKRVGQPDDLASAVRFLLSEQSAWITGQVLHVDGGISTLKT